MNRRNFIRNSSLLTIGTGLVPGPATEGEDEKAALSFAFLTDIHVKPVEVAESGMRKAFRRVNALKKKPEFILNGGDAIMDALAADKVKTQEQWDIWNKIIQEENGLPIYHVIGNHDVWGWQVKDESIKSDPLYDKAWAVKQHKMPGRFYTFEKKEWKFGRVKV